MTGVAQGSRAMVVLVRDDQEIVLGSVGPGKRCDVALVDDLTRFRLAAARLGWSIRLVEVDSDLRELLVLVGLEDCLA